MNSFSFKYLLLITIALISGVSGEVHSGIGSSKKCVLTYCQLRNNESSKTIDHILLIRNNESWLISPGEKVENITVSCPVSDVSAFRYANNSNLQLIIFTIKNFSLISHNILFLARTVHLSSFVNVLRN